MNYDLTILDPIEFEELVCDLLSEELGDTFESFKVGKDQGIDLRHICKNTEETTIVQCKRYGENQFSNLKHSLGSEVEKIKGLQPERYIIATSIPLSPENKKDIFKIVKPWCKSERDILGKNELNSMLGRYDGVLKKHFKLWISSTAVLERIINSKTYNYTESEIETFSRELRKIVVHDGFYKCMDIIDEYNHVMIAGNPGIGKTTVAKLMLLNFMADGFEPVIVTSNIDDAWTVAHRIKDDKNKLVLLYDDFLGRTEFRKEKLQKNEDKKIIELIKKCERNKNLKIIFTTREYIFEDAKRQNGALYDHEAEFEKYSIIMEDYSLKNKAIILFNHLYFSDLPDEKLDLIVRSEIYRKIVLHKNYNPRIIAFICSNKIAKKYQGQEYLDYIINTLENPKAIWEKPFHDDISKTARSILLILLSLNGKCSIFELKDLTKRSMKGGVSTDFSIDFMNSLKQVDGSFTKSKKIRSQEDEDFTIEFNNPSVEDFLLHYIRKNPEAVVEIIDSVIYFNQVSNLTNIFHSTTRFSSERNHALALLLEKAETTSDNFVTKSQGFSWSKKIRRLPEKISPFGINHTKAQIIESLNEKIPSDLIETYSSPEYWREQIETGKRSTRSVIQLNQFCNFIFKSHQITDKEKNEIEDSLRQAILVEDVISDITYDLADLVELEHALTKSSTPLTDDQIELIEMTAEDEFLEEVLESTDLSEVEEALELIEHSCLLYTTVHSSIEDKVEELREDEEEDDSAGFRSTRPKRDKSSQTDLGEIFSRLKRN